MFEIAKHSFNLPKDFLEPYKTKQPDWDGLALFTFKRTYARDIEDEGRTEEWWETCRRVVEGTFSIQKNYCKQHHLPWDEKKSQRTAKRMFELMWNFKFLPPGRGLWAMGSDAVIQKGGAVLNNCAFVSTKDIDQDFAAPFCFIMDMSMLGVGVGFDTAGANKVRICSMLGRSTEKLVIDDTREGWIDSVNLLLNHFIKGFPLPEFDYSRIRKAGQPIKTFGGTASGPEPLMELHKNISDLLNSKAGQLISSSDIVDIGNFIGKCVVAGNVRRSSEIVLGDPNDKEYVLLKQDKEKLISHRWNSNNSVYAEPGMNYEWLAEQTAQNGEPGYQWMDNARAYGRMKDTPNWKDREAMGTNPCLPAWATVLTPDGISTISKVNIGDIIWSGKEWTKITNKWSNGIKQVCGHHTTVGIFYGTDDHNIISNGERVKVVDAESIDVCAGPNAHFTISNLDPQDIMDGLVIGDGSVHKASNNLVYLIIGKDDQDYLESEIKSLLKEYRPGLSELAWEIETTVQAHELPKTYNRQVPDRFRFGTPQKMAGFLRGLFSANGSICGNRVTLRASSFTIIQQVQEMLSALGIRSYNTTSKASEIKFNNGTYTCKESYDVNISVDRDIFRRVIGFIHGYKNDKLESLCENVGISKFAHVRAKKTYDITSREVLSEEEVFDLTVDSDDHTFWCGGLLISNCNEQTLFNYELCNLVETFPAKHDSLDEYLETLKIAYLYGKTVTLVPTHYAQTNSVMIRNRRIGLSQSGIVRAFAKHGYRKMLEWCDKGYEFIQGLDLQYSNWLGVPRSIKTTSVKPSGTVSLLAQEPPGIHYPHSEYYIRRVRVGIHSPMWKDAKKAGYKVETVVGQENSTMVVEFPIHEKNFIKSKSDVSIWEQVANVIAYQKYWADNQVSCTISFKKDEAADIKHVLELYEDSLKGISFLPLEDHGYVQAPYETITQTQYEEMTKNLRPIVFNNKVKSSVPRFCDGDKCEI